MTVSTNAIQNDFISNFIKITCPLFLRSMDRLLLKYSSEL
jgi:hypothetical protein